MWINEISFNLGVNIQEVSAAVDGGKTLSPKSNNRMRFERDESEHFENVDLQEVSKLSMLDGS